MADNSNLELDERGPLTPTKREAAEKANEEIANIEEGGKILSGPAGEPILSNYEKTVELEAENVRDPLTGAFNRRYFDKELDKRLNGNQKIAMAMVDVDHFKEFNDAYGHKNGDRLLIEIVRVMSNRLRLARPNGSKDFIARYGGEEFAVILADISDPADAFKVMDALRNEIENAKFKIDQETNVKKTVSIGVTLSWPNSNPDELVNKADKAMYKAKDKGRDRVELSI